MAAAIKNEVGMEVFLEEGHAGIFQLAIGNQIIYTNYGKCGHLPENAEIIEKVKECKNSSMKYSLKKKDVQQTIGSDCCPDCYDSSVEASSGSDQSCCCSINAIDKNENTTAKRRLEIDFLYLDLSVCVPCRGTDNSLEEAIADVSQVLRATGIEVVVRKINIQNEEQARELGFVSSPTIRINGRDIQLEVRESLCVSCGDLCGDDVDCRLWFYNGKEYNVPPKAMIIEAILKEVYGGEVAKQTVPPRGDIPENLKRFFAAKRKKESSQKGCSCSEGCCSQ